jgi:RNA polymerase sigma factor (sigma-70 family)
MFKMAYKFCGNRQDAEDITQESCIRLARGLHSFKGDSAFTSWLYRLVINTAKDWYKSNNRHPKSDEGLETAEVSAKAKTSFTRNRSSPPFMNCPKASATRCCS